MRRFIIFTIAVILSVVAAFVVYNRLQLAPGAVGGRSAVDECPPSPAITAERPVALVAQTAPPSTSSNWLSFTPPQTGSVATGAPVMSISGNSAKETFTRFKSSWDKGDWVACEHISDDLERTAPSYVPALVLRAFVKVVFRGEIYDARQTLADLVQDQSLDRVFRTKVSVQVRLLDMEIHSHKVHHVSEDTLRKNADPGKYRDVMNGNVPPLLELVGDSPDAYSAGI